jgi:hypothetical protein
MQTPAGLSAALQCGSGAVRACVRAANNPCVVVPLGLGHYCVIFTEHAIY